MVRQSCHDEVQYKEIGGGVEWFGGIWFRSPSSIADILKRAGKADGSRPRRPILLPLRSFILRGSLDVGD